VKIGDELPVTATGLAASGAGTCTAAGVEIEVTDLLPGESADVEIAHKARHRPRAFARIRRRTGPLAGIREAPACPAFGQCGGCVWQHVRYDAQLKAKAARLAEALAELPELPPISAPWPAATQLGYRNKGIYRITQGSEGIVLGANVPRSGDIVDTRGCKVVHPAIDSVAREVAEALAAGAVGAVDRLRYLVVRAGRDDRLLVGIVSRSPTPDLGALTERLAGRGDVSSVVAVENDAASDSVLGDGTMTALFGNGTVDIVIAGQPVAAGLDSFVQVHAEQAERMYRTAAEWAVEVGAHRAADLYCGLGGFAFALAGAGLDVVGVERSQDAERASAASALEFIRAEADAVDLQGRDLVVVNPPRRGLSPEALAELRESGCPHVIYISCSPSSLSRDLDVLGRHGYRVVRVQPIDLMPGTPHIETMVLLNRS